jgi:hypothetical protein
MEVRAADDEYFAVLKPFSHATLLLLSTRGGILCPMTDVVVLLPGITGSVLRDADGVNGNEGANHPGAEHRRP